VRLYDELHAKWDGLPECEVIVADEIFAQMYNANRGVNRIWQPDEFPNIAPVFKDFWIEAYMPSMNLCQGAFFEVHEGDDLQLFIRKLDYNPPSLKWIYSIRASAKAHGYLLRSACWMAIFVSSEGRWLKPENVTHVLYESDTQFLHGKSMEEFLKRDWYPTDACLEMLPHCFMTLSLMHCKNVSTEKVKPPESRQVRRHWERKHGRALSSYHVLKIRPRGDAHRASDAPRIATGLTREHIARGHFKTFTEEAPLFGKWTGTFWWDMQLRGNPARGTAYKDYEVQQ
jgi:hypothetical protein